MDPAEIELAKLAHHAALVAMQAAAAYNQAQSSLNLAQVIDPQQLASFQGTQSSRNIVNAFADLTSEHKRMFATLVTQVTSQVVAAANELPPLRRMQVRDSMMESVNWNLAAQSQLYEGRERWIAAATSILDLIDLHRAEIDFENDTLLFRSDVVLEEFNLLLETMEAVHRQELAQFNERHLRLLSAAERRRAVP